MSRDYPGKKFWPAMYWHRKTGEHVVFNGPLEVPEDYVETEAKVGTEEEAVIYGLEEAQAAERRRQPEPEPDPQEQGDPDTDPTTMDADGNEIPDLVSYSDITIPAIKAKLEELGEPFNDRDNKTALYLQLKKAMSGR